MFSYIFLVIIGLVVLWASAEILIKALTNISKHLGISDTFIGLTILSIGTSFPELGTHVYTAIDKLEGLDITPVAVGTNIGSNLFQITIILGIVAFYSHIKASRDFLKKDYMFMLASILALFLFGLDGYIGRVEGAILVIAYLVYLYHLGRVEHFVRDSLPKKRKKGEVKLWSWIAVPLGLTLLWFSASTVAENAHNLAQLWHVSDGLIGALLIGIGTALPEFITAIVAIKKKASGMSIGVLVGSNITNPLFCLGVGAMVAPHHLTKGILFFDLPVWFVASLVALGVLWTKGKIQKEEAIGLIGLYIVYYYARIAFVG